MDESSISEKSVIDRAIKGEESAYRFLLEKYKSFAFTIALRIVNNREDAEEIVQDAFIKAFKSISRFKRVGKFSTWLYKIVYHTALTKIRGTRIETDPIEEHLSHLLSVPDTYKTGFNKLQQDDQIKYVNRAMLNLDKTDKMMITLYYTCECSISEVSEITGWKNATIKVRLYRARQKLFTELSRFLKGEMKDLL